MAGILDQLLGTGADDPRTQAMGILGQGLMAGNPAAAFGNANASFAQARDAAMKRQLLQAQLANYQSEIEQRKAAIAKQTQLQEMAQRIINGGGASPAMPGQLGSGSFGAVSPPAGMSDMPPPRPGGLGGASLNDIVALHAAGGPDLLNAYKYASEGVERKPGSFYDIPGRGREFIPAPEKGIDFRNGRVSPLPGYSDFLTQQTLAQEAPKTLLNSAAQINLRKNPDGTESPVSSLSENPTLQNVLRGIFPGGPAAGAVTQPAAPAAPNPNRAARITPDEQRARDAEAIRLIQVEIDKEQNPQTKAGLQRELDRMTAAQARPGFPTPSASQPGIGYGKTTDQEIADAARKEKAVADAKAAADRDATRAKGAVSSKDTLSHIAEARNLLGQGPTNSGVGSMVDSTASFFGKSTKSADLAAQLDTLSGWMVSNVPRMEGPQSNFDVQNYKTMAALVGDRTKPVSQRLAALDTLEGLQQKYAHLNGRSDNSAPAKVVDVLPKTAPKGTRARDTATGQVKVFNGMSWVPEK